VLARWKEVPLALVCATQGHNLFEMQEESGGPGLAGNAAGWEDLERLSILM